MINKIIRLVPFPSSLRKFSNNSNNIISAISRTRTGSSIRFLSSKHNDSTSMKIKKGTKRKLLPDDGVTLSHFTQSGAAFNNNSYSDDTTTTTPDKLTLNFGPLPTSATLGLDKYCDDDGDYQGQQHSTIQQYTNHVLKFHLKTYGCQMNVNDSDIVRSILLDDNDSNNNKDNKNHHFDKIKFEETNEEMDADILLTNTCAIRENAESKVWNRLKQLRALDSKNPITKRNNSSSMKQQQGKRKRIIGVLGCMAERLKEDMFKDNTADLIAGPDAYRDLPRLISALAPKPLKVQPFLSSYYDNFDSSPMLERAINVELSFDETYADIKPIRSNPGDVSAFVSVMRGCNNMCSYCVVPFTRGRERSREFDSIVNEARILYEESGVKEICLLGQNVNSYHDRSDSAVLAKPQQQMTMKGNTATATATTNKMKYKAGYNTSNDGFSNMFRLRGGSGYYFVDLVEAVSDISPELRVRFTSPHPKDYPTELLSLMAERNNVCNQLHMPAQSGSSQVLKRMRRGYTREAYMELIDDVRTKIPDVAITSDFITGFCGETEEEHEKTLSLMEYVKYDQAFMFAYSMRGKTNASRTMVDDIPEEIKSRRLQEIIHMFRTSIQLRNDETEVGKLRLVLVEGEARKSKEGSRQWRGRTDQNKSVIFPTEGESPMCWSEDAVKPILDTAAVFHHQSSSYHQNDDNTALHVAEKSSDSILNSFVHQAPKVELKAGDYAVVIVDEARGHTLRGKLLWRATMQGFNEIGLDQICGAPLLNAMTSKLTI
mmetsp:Transcript_3898/g.4218  ORF Transcript_3898/g.4218 Transcript_3898/m.4218 type:complete len:772 (+) Transcript_3898:92-2407(+)